MNFPRVEDVSMPLAIAENPLSDFESDDDTEGFDFQSTDAESGPRTDIPSTEIKAQFYAAVSEGFTFDGEFAVSSHYAMDVAPNPCLELDGLGTVGLPLSDRDACAFMSCEFVHNRDNGTAIWEIPSENIHFDNPTWDKWIQNTAGPAAVLALTASKTKSVVFSLKRLVLYAPGSRSSRVPYDTAIEVSANTSVGHLMVILPSRHEGGKSQLQHAGRVKTWDLAQESGRRTSIVAAYWGVNHTQSSLVSGYRLALVYEVIHHPKPGEDCLGLPQMNVVHRDLHNILRSWKDHADAAPQFLLCLLKHQYFKIPTFSAESLTGSDAAIAAHLRPLARQLGFRILLAHIDFIVTGSACVNEDEDDEYERYDEDENYYDERDFEDYGEPYEAVELRRIVNLGGIPVDVDLDIEPEDLLKGSATEYDPDDEIFEREERTEASRTKIYKRTILLLLPKHGKIDATIKIGDVYDFACATLERSSGPTPRARDKLLADNLIECCRTRPQDTRLKRAVHVLIALARQWNNLDILLRTLNAGQVKKNILLLGGDDFVSTYKTFGWDAMRQFYTDAVNNDQSNARREVLLSRLTQMAADENDSSLAVWCTTQEEIILRSLRKVDAAELPAIVNRSLSRGGEFLLDVVVPQVRAQNAPVTVWRVFLKCLHKHLVTTRAMPSRDIDIVRGLITECVTGLIQSTPAFPQKVTKDGRHRTHTMDPPAILRMIRFCVETQNVACCVLIFAKMRDAIQHGDFVRIYPPWQYYTGICADLVQYMETVPGIEPTFRPFFVDAVDAMLARTWTTSKGMAVDPCNLTYNASTLTLAAKKAGGASTLREKLTKEILSGCDSRTLQALARSVATEFPRAESEVSANDDMLATLVRAAIDKFSPSLGTSFRSDWYSGGPACNQMLDLLKFCSEVGVKDQHHYLLSHLLQPPAGSTLEKYASDSLTPFLPLLKQHLLAQSQSFAVKPYRSFAATVVQTFAEQVMADKPPEVASETDIQKIGCKDPDCSGCADLRSFLLGEQSTKLFTLPKTVLTHLEHKVARTASWGVICETTRPGGSRSLKITKPNTMMAHTAWSASSEIGKSLLDTLGDRAMQEAVLGAQYGWVRARITGET
ncbi:hypothetical protein B0H14DRAFT_2485121 [Mycena olivaceomarginata]|nr:hypothetical protein B0H14DRAFT_2485121 [Mycena olivaceomarginata]